MKKFVAYTLILLLTLVWNLPVMADQLNDAKKKKQTIDSKINSLTQQKQTVTKQKTQVAQKSKDLQTTQKVEDKKYKQLQDEINDVIDEIKDIDGAIDEAEENYSHQQELFKSRLRVMYENSSNSSYLEALLESKSITDFFSRLELISMISKSDKQLVESLAVAKQDVEYKRKLKEEEKRGKLAQADNKKKAIEDIKASRASLEDKLKELNTTLKKLDEQEDALIAQSQEVEKQIKSLQKKGTKYAGGIMAWPTNGSRQVTSSFGMRFHPVLKKNKLHTGVDIRASKGDEIYAANKGTVIFAGWNGAYGNTVIIDHGGGISTLYAHCSKILTDVGNNVSTGTLIAKVGSTGLSTGAHLHFEVRKDGEPVDPLAYINPK